MSFKIKKEHLFFVACQLFLLSLLWVFVSGRGNTLLAISHVCMWASLALFDNLSSGAAMLAFISSVIYGIFAVLVLKTESCQQAKVINCLFAFMLKFLVSFICGLIDLSIYEASAHGSIFRKSIVLGLFHVMSLSTQWAISETSSYIVLLAFVHVVHWAWFPHAANVASAVCVVVAAQVALEEDTFANGSLLFTALSCLAVDILSKEMQAKL